MGAIQQSDHKLWTFSASILDESVVGPERTSLAWSRKSMLLQGKQPMETPLKICARSNGRIKSYGPIEPVLLSRRWYDLNGPERTQSTWSRDSMLLQGKQSTETPLNIWARSNGRNKSYRPFDPVLWSCRWDAPTDIIGVQ